MAESQISHMINKESNLIGLFDIKNLSCIDTKLGTVRIPREDQSSKK